MNTTRFPLSALPVAFASSRLLVPSTKTKCVFPISPFAFSLAASRNVSMTSANRLCFTSSGTSSVNFFDAAVFSRKEYANVNACSYCTRFKSEMVSLCSSSVSPQKPEIKSELNATSGMIAFALSIKFMYASREYPRFIRSSADVDPDCAGICNNFEAFGVSEIVWSRLSGKSLGCGDVNRTRNSGEMAHTSFNNLAKSYS
mmetsp:Transcript_8816/g.28386  ORF Transcript_8816/g.28386 Transcript_8816/m.28386 type:complete len:201 (+) Transcript_8816:188-790(+)